MALEENTRQIPRLAEGIESIARPLERHFLALDAFLEEQVAAFEPEVQPLVRFTFRHSGKKIRPILVFYSGFTEDVSPAKELVQAAAIVELVHLATLVHDDILDGATIRHQIETAATRYGDHAAVLLGDALFAHALKLAADFPDVKVCRVVAQATRQVCSGEIAQTFARSSTDITIQQYLRFIDLKTAELFAVSAYLGALLGGLGEPFALAAEHFARKLGSAYQIYDDLTDFFGEEAKAGKTLGTDLATGKLTLPVLLLMEALPPEKRATLKLEIAGGRASLKSLNEEMLQFGVYESVRTYFLAEVEAAEAALEPFRDLPAARALPRLSGFIRQAIERHAPATG